MTDQTNVHWLLCANTKINLASLSGVQLLCVWHCWWISQAAAASGLSLKQTSGIPAIPEYKVTEYLISPLIFFTFVGSKLFCYMISVGFRTVCM